MSNRPLRRSPCRKLCDWGAPGVRIEQDLVFSCAGCGSEWTRHEGWTPCNRDGSIPEGIRRERGRGRG